MEGLAFLDIVSPIQKHATYDTAMLWMVVPHKRSRERPLVKQLDMSWGRETLIIPRSHGPFVLNANRNGTGSKTVGLSGANGR